MSVGANCIRLEHIYICYNIVETPEPQQQPEAAYQRALEIQLEARSIDVLPEVKFGITYRGREISSRGLGLFLKILDGSSATVELKAVLGLTTNSNRRCPAQLQYYMGSL